ncbi:unnamed protein product [Prunus armeniaca]|uniref:UBC core domain-containing protein n=1 Tax=Prunus armeniaca TaxID=36596 RepID=A0A6J5VJA2_PRUAR|nr:unnamed protein product [Prunus armeniaca]
MEEEDKCHSARKRFQEEFDRRRSSVMEEDKLYLALKRVAEEYDEIESNPSDDFKCGLLGRNMFEWQFAVRGAIGSEFEGGIYHGRIQFPEDYPSKPPSFMFLTENGRFKIKTKIRLKWRPSWRVRDALLELIDLMSTYPDGEMGSVEYNKEERRALAIKSRAAPPKYGTCERQKVIDEIHEYMLSKVPPIPVPPQLHSQNHGAKRKHGTGGTGSSGGDNGSVVNVIGNTFHAINSNGVGFLDSMNEAFNPKKAKRCWLW